MAEPLMIWLAVKPFRSCCKMCPMPTREYPAGRKSKYSPQMQAALCCWLKKGCSFKDACAMEGISYETFRTWQSEKSVFSVAIKKAEAECKAARIATILKASEKSWQATFTQERSCLSQDAESSNNRSMPSSAFGISLSMVPHTSLRSISSYS